MKTSNGGNNDHRDFKRALRFEFLIIVLFLSVSGFYALDLVPHQLEKLVFGTIALIGLIPVVQSAVESLRKRKINVDLLASVALFFSFINGFTSGEWGSLLFINLMLAFARVLDLYTKRRVQKSLEGLSKLKPLRARVLRDKQPVEVPLSEIKVGDLVVVNLGEQVPVDGIVFSGDATVDQSSLTGESVPVLRTTNDPVFAATIVASGNIVVRAQRIGSETTFELMVKLVEASQDAKTRMKTIAERFASWYIGIMLIVAVVLYFSTGGNTALVLAVVLVVCADDIAVAIPLAYIIAIGTAARRGIIIKSADFIDSTARIATLIVDKTGTLTLGKLTAKRVRSFCDTELSRVLELACSIGNGSTHPVSKAIVRYAKETGVDCEAPNHFKEVEGRGIIGTGRDGQKIILGRPDFLNEQSIRFDDEVSAAIAEGIAQSNNVTLLALNGKVIGLFALADEIREEVAGAITALKKGGIKKVVMLTGDNEGVAKNIASRLGIDKYYARLLPEHKVLVLKEHLGKGGTVAMVGDGVNDAAVLTRADVGIAMGGIGTDAAIEAADIVLMKDDFGGILEIRTIAKKVIAVARGNFAIWAVVNSVGLYFVFTGVFDPSKAAAYNFLTDFIPIANSLRLFNYRRNRI